MFATRGCIKCQCTSLNHTVLSFLGVATYCKDSASPFSAEEGLTGLLNTSHEGAVGSYGNQKEFSSEELQLLDNEGRAVITQHKVMYDGEKVLLLINSAITKIDWLSDGL